MISKEFQAGLWPYLGGICKNIGVGVLAIGGAEDHVHLLVNVPPSLAVAKAVGTVKSNSSKWANGARKELAWQQGYSAFSVSASVVPAVVRYIRNQEKHHKRMKFDAEYLALLKKHGVDFDERFVFG